MSIILDEKNNKLIKRIKKEIDEKIEQLEKENNTLDNEKKTQKMSKEDNLITEDELEELKDFGIEEYEIDKFRREIPEIKWTFNNLKKLFTVGYVEDIKMLVKAKITNVEDIEKIAKATYFNLKSDKIKNLLKSGTFENGIDELLKSLYEDSKITDIEEINRLINAGINSDEAKIYYDTTGINDAATMEYIKKEDIYIFEAKDYYKAGITNGDEMIMLKMEDINGHNVECYHKADITDIATMIELKKGDVSPEDAIFYKKAGIIDAATMLALEEAGVSSYRVKRYHKAGITDPAKIIELEKKGITSNIAKAYYDAGVKTPEGMMELIDNSFESLKEKCSDEGIVNIATSKCEYLIEKYFNDALEKLISSLKKLTGQHTINSKSEELINIDAIDKEKYKDIYDKIKELNDLYKGCNLHNFIYSLDDSYLFSLGDFKEHFKPETPDNLKNIDEFIKKINELINKTEDAKLMVDQKIEEQN